MKYKLLHFLPLLSLGIMLLSCTKSSTVASESVGLVHSFPNILNVKGVPDSSTDRSVFMFSDLGAWHGYALPENSDSSFRGSFIGPFLMTQDNGIWISQCLSQLNLFDVKRKQELDWNTGKIVENNAYPNSLRQIIEFDAPGLAVQVDLIFISDRTALLKTQLKNIGAQRDLRLELRWQGNSLLEGVSFSSQKGGVLVQFGKNQHLGLITSNLPKQFTTTISDQGYQLRSKEIIVKQEQQWTMYLTQSFCFSEEELNQEQSRIQSLFDAPDASFAINESTWNDQLSHLLDKLHPSFEDPSHQQIALKCMETLKTNWRSPAGFLEFAGLFPSYNYEWFHGLWSWDSWKHSVALAYFDTDLAQNQIRAMYHFQDSLGMIADCVYRDTVIENFNWRDTKPPLSAWATWEVFQHSQDQSFLEDLFPKIEKYHRWWYQYRDHDQNGLCEFGSTDGTLIAAKWESGMDNAVRFDATTLVRNNDHGWSMNRESVDLNAYLFAEKEYLAKIAKALGDNEKEIQYQQEAEELKRLIQTLFYDEETGWFYDLDLESKEQLKIFGSEGWIPLWSGAAHKDQAERVRATMLDSAHFATYIPFPTLSAAHPKFKPRNGYWRGPVWLDQAYFAIRGLRNYGYEEDALRFSKQLFDRMEGLKDSDQPIWENYHPHTGEGMESRHFSWSAAFILLLLLGQ